MMAVGDASTQEALPSMRNLTVVIGRDARKISGGLAPDPPWPLVVAGEEF